MWMSNPGYCTNEIMFCFEIYCRESLSHFVLACVTGRGRLRFNDQNSCTAAREYLGSLGTPPQLFRRVIENFSFSSSGCHQPLFSHQASPRPPLPSGSASHTPPGFLASPLMLGEIAFSRDPAWEVSDSRNLPLPPAPLSLGWAFPSHCWGLPKPPGTGEPLCAAGSTAFLSLQALQCYRPLLSWCLISLFYHRAPSRAFHIYKNVYIIYPVTVI